MGKSLIYYTNHLVDEPIYSDVQRRLSQVGLPIISISLKPINFGENYTVDGESGPYTLIRQIIKALEFSSGKYVFFCEHDVLYPNSHFDFTPTRDDMYYYNAHVWRWDYPKNHFITYDRLISLSSLCCNRELALKQFKAREDMVLKKGWDKDKGRDPEWARIMGFEPGTKKRKRGGFDDSDFETWRSPDPIIDIRHDKTYSKRKCRLKDFKHPPENWRETEDLWNLVS